MKVNANGIDMQYTLDGPATAPVLTLSHSLATDLSMWDPQMGALTARYRRISSTPLFVSNFAIPAG